VTAAEFAQVQEGMSYADVVRLVGAEATEKISSGGQGTPLSSDSCTWRNPDGSVMSADFLNGALYSKTQFDLK